jgi:LPXTG-motif cell wall-anchored protein
MPEGPTTSYEPNNPGAQSITRPAGVDELAQTGAGSLGTTISASAGLLLGGAVLYRRARASA